MKEILLSTSLILALAFAGCNDNDKTTTLETSSIDDMARQNVALSISAGKREIATLNSTGISYKIVGGVDKGYFELVGKKLFFKTSQSYIKNGDNSYKVEISATDDTNQRKGRLLLVTVNVVAGSAVIIGDKDTTPPVFTLASSLTMSAGASLTITATDSSMPITYTLKSDNGAGFTLDGAVLTAPNRVVSTNVTIEASDNKQNSVSKTILITVSSENENSLVQIGNFEWSVVDFDARKNRLEANNSCPAGMKFPTAQEFESTGAANLITNLHITAIKPFWIDDNATSSYVLDATSDPVDGYTYNNEADMTTAYFTCVKPKP